MSLLLTIDVGNTNTVLGVHDGAELKAHWRLTTRREQTADEYGILVRNLFAASGLEPARDRGRGARERRAAAHPGAGRALARQYLGHEPLVVEPGVRTGMPILYEPPGDVGADRIVNGVAAFAAYGGPVIVVDFGTATTFDVVTRKGEYVGGVICPGVGISADALFQRAARLPRVDVRNPGRVIGRSTVGSIQSGLYFGYAAMVRGHHRPHPRGARREPARVVATGGLAETLAPDIPAIEAVDPVLDPDRPAPHLGTQPAGLRRRARPWPRPRGRLLPDVEEFFVSRRGDPLFLSNADWHLIRKWRQAGMPLRVVLRGIRDALDGHATSFSRDRKVGSLAYCAREVEAARERWRSALARAPSPASTLPAVLRGFALDLRAGERPRAAGG